MARPRKNAPKKPKVPKAPKAAKVAAAPKGGIVVNVHHHNYPPRIPAQKVVHSFGPHSKTVVTPVRPVAATATPMAPVAPMRPRPAQPTNSGLRFSGNPNAFRFGGGNRGPQGDGGLGGGGGGLI